MDQGPPARYALEARLLERLQQAQRAYQAARTEEKRLLALAQLQGPGTRQSLVAYNNALQVADAARQQFVSALDEFTALTVKGHRLSGKSFNGSEGELFD